MRSVHHIEAPVEKVFELFIDPSAMADMELGGVGQETRDVKLTADGNGTSYSWNLKVAGVRIPGENFNVYLDVVPNKHITEKSSRAIVGTWEYSFEPEDGGTKLTMEHHSRSIWAVPPLSTLMDMAMPRMNEQFMRQLKDRIEPTHTEATDAEQS
jgi:uncharacterized protein YndB with AHSA1/START domain